ncbi:hypothetical protein [Microbacterium sp. NC79]|nr:hypothetical protein [Microbacterium sp. NC79]MBV0894155.1 hypothetical protein [Microbacterium sp. NC79]
MQRGTVVPLVAGAHGSVGIRDDGSARVPPKAITGTKLALALHECQLQS